MIVVSDTGPIRYLHELEAQDVLPELYGKIVVPRVIVEKELASPGTPGPLRQWIAAAPSWIEIDPSEFPSEESVAGLGAGETSAILLAIKRRADLLLCDDYDARKVAQAMGLAVVGTLGVLVEAGWKGLLDFDTQLDRLAIRTNFRASPHLIAEVRRLYHVRKP